MSGPEYGNFGDWPARDLEFFKNKRLFKPKFVEASDAVEGSESSSSARGPGWYLMPRGWMTWDAFQPEKHTEREAYQWSVEQAAFKDHRQWFNGSLYEVKRGEFVTSQHAMMAALGWTEKPVRNFISRMVKEKLWAKRPAYKGAKAPTVLIVCNYDVFQRPPRKADPTASPNEE